MIQDSESWINEQFANCDLGNQMRTRRLEKVATAMLAAPEQSLPEQNSTWADLKAAYRLFDQEKVTFDAVAQPHWQQTRRTGPGRFLLISDTTDIDHFNHRATSGLSHLGKGTGYGMQLHHCLMYNSSEQLIVGIAGALVHYRPKACKKETRMQRLARVRESEVWGNLVRQIGSAPKQSQWIHVFDRGGDNFEAMCHIRLQCCDWVIRAAKLNRNVLTRDGEKLSLKDALKTASLLGSYDLHLRSRPGVSARIAEIEVLTLSVTFPRPRHQSPWLKQCEIDELEMNVVIVQEVNPPQGKKPIRWVLLTSLPASTFQEAWQVIEDYENRWLVEEYHKVLKTGCNIESHALRTAERLEALMGLVTVLGSRLLALKLVGRSQPDAKAKSHVPSSWLEGLKLARPELKTREMTVYTFFREVAKLGGFLGRKHDGEPGWQTVWRGYRKLQSILDTLRLTGAI